MSLLMRVEPEDHTGLLSDDSNTTSGMTNSSATTVLLGVTDESSASSYAPPDRNAGESLNSYAK